MTDRCVCCGEIIPEGSQVCGNCVTKAQSTEKRKEWIYREEPNGKRYQMQEIVRCKDCIEYRGWLDGNIRMRFGSYYGGMNPDFFCAYGARRKKEQQ